MCNEHYKSPKIMSSKDQQNGDRHISIYNISSYKQTKKTHHYDYRNYSDNDRNVELLHVNRQLKIEKEPRCQMESCQKYSHHKLCTKW